MSKSRSDDTSPTELPRLELHQRQRLVRVPIREILGVVTRALPGVMRSPGRHEAQLPTFDHVAAYIFSDRRMASLHRKFLGTAGTTDVITFHHGEICLGAQVAQRWVLAHGGTLIEELSRYWIHGLLHLNGHDDHDPVERRIMMDVQERILQSALPPAS